MDCLRKAIKKKEPHLQGEARGHMVEGCAITVAYVREACRRERRLIDQDGEDKTMSMGEFC